MSAKKDDVLLKKLQKTIDAWSAEVTDAHQELTCQIGDAKSQLDTLIDVLDSSKKAPAPASAQPAQSNTPQTVPKTSPPNPSREFPNENIQAITLELEEAHTEIAALRASREEQLANLDAELMTAKLEIKSLTSAAKAIKAESDTRHALRTRSEAESAADMDTVEAFVELQSKEIGNLKAELHSKARRYEQFAETEEALRGELENVRAETDNQKAGLERAAAISQEQQQLIADHQTELTDLKDEYDLLCSGEQALRSEADALHVDLQASRQSEQELRDQLTSMMLNFERQAEALDESIKELETHWDLAKEADATEKQLKKQIERLENELSAESNAAIRAQEDLQSTQHQLEQAHVDHTREMEDLRVKKQDEIYTVLKTLGEHGLSHSETDFSLELTLKQTRIDELAQLNDSLTGSMQELQARLASLEESSSELAAKADEELPAIPAETIRLQEELKAFEESLIEREAAIETAAEKMKMLEETAIAVQAQIADLHAAHESADEPEYSEEEREAARREIETLKASLAEMTQHSNAQASRVQQMSNDLAEAQRHSEQIGSDYEEAAAENDGTPHLLSQSLAEIDALRDRLAHRDMEIERLRRDATPLDQPVEAPQMTFAAHDAKGKTRSMGEILLNAGIITTQQLDSALAEQRSANKRRLGSILVEKGLIREEMVAQVVASQLNLPFCHLSEQEIDRGAIALMNGRLATHHMCFPISATTEQITVAMANPLDLIAIEDLEFATSLKVNPVVATLSDITSAIVQHYGVSIANAIAEDNFESQTPQNLPAQDPTPQVGKAQTS